MTFFSGTDTDTLKEEGNERNCFVSLIVNNAGTYSAAVTRKIQCKSEVTVKTLGKSYEFFGNGEIQTPNDESETTKIVDKEYIEYFMLDVEREEVENNLDYLDTRFDEISKKKKEKLNKTLKETPKSYDIYKPLQPFYYDYDNDLPWWKDPVLDDKKDKTEKPKAKSTKKPKKEETIFHDIEDNFSLFDPKLIHKTAVRLITCSFILDDRKFDLDKWVDKYMVKIYKKTFTDKSFDDWCGLIVDFTLSNFRDPKLPGMEYVDVSMIAQALLGEIAHLRNSNEYMIKYCEELELYI